MLFWRVLPKERSRHGFWHAAFENRCSQVFPGARRGDQSSFTLKLLWRMREQTPAAGVCAVYLRAYTPERASWKHREYIFSMRKCSSRANMVRLPSWGRPAFSIFWEVFLYLSCGDKQICGCGRHCRRNVPTRRPTLRQRLGAIAEAGGKGARLFPLSFFGMGRSPFHKNLPRSGADAAPHRAAATVPLSAGADPSGADPAERFFRAFCF